MLPVYNAVSFNGILTRGGRTQPWVFVVKEDEELIPYVVKMFTPLLVNEHNAVLNEVIGNRFAKEFDITVPEAAFIKIDEALITNLEALEQYQFKDDRLKFGTRAVSGSVEFVPDSYKFEELDRIVDVETLFAYDFLIQNRDRNWTRPNFIISRGRGYAIDHEKAFDINANSAGNMLADPRKNGIYHGHIFFNLLKKRMKAEGVTFDTFHEYLRTLDTNVLTSYFEQLAELGYPIEKQKIITEYLGAMKANSLSFVERMKEVIL